IITDVPYVYINFKKKNQKPLKSMNVKRAMQFLKQGHFGEGSMKPKVEAAINFLSSGGKKVIITSPQNVEKALKGRSGTIIVK
ncbi:MAG: carbamate kinase, partial [Nanoarchaeota archaeon]